MADVAVKQTECNQKMSTDNKDNCKSMAACVSEMRQYGETAMAGYQHMFDKMCSHIPQPQPAKKAKRSRSDEDDSDDDSVELKLAARKKYKS